MHGLIHRHLHKQKTQSQPEKPFAVRLLDRATVAAGVIGPLMTLPQIFEIYIYHNASGVSALSWFAFGILDIPFILYGIVHKDKPIISTYILWIIANFVVAFGALIYR